MYCFVSALLAWTAINAATATPIKSRSPYVVKETHAVPPKWSKIGIPSPDTIIDLRIGFQNKRFNELERHLYEVSDPLHTRYGQHLTVEEIDELSRPDQKASSLVDEWLEDFGIPTHQRQYNAAGDWITIALPVHQVEKLLDTKYSVFRHDDGNVLIRTPDWSLPQHLHDHIATIQPTNAFLRATPELATSLKLPLDIDLSLPPDPSLSTGNINVDCNFELVTPNCLRTLYNTRDYKPKGGANTVGFTNYLGQVPNKLDTTLYLTTFRPDTKNGQNNYKEVSIAGGPTDNGTNAGTEADLDVQTILGISYPLKVTSYSTGGSPPFKPDLATPTDTNEPYLTWLQYISGQSSIPQTISTSYGDDEQSVPLSYAQSVCQGLAKLGARGVTLLFSSGDSGVGAAGSCQSNDGKNTTTYLPAFPASCPYITAVGGTKSYPEVIATDTLNGYVSGSGFSNYFSRPSYQDKVVASYLPTIDPSLKSLYNASGRAYPDIAAQGYHYAIYYQGMPTSVDGTSCAAPCTAGVISLVNDALIAKGKSPLGFLNPLLYSGLGAKAFNDVQGGSSTGCGTNGFKAQKGWDVASGFGSPDFKKIVAALGVST